MKFGHKTIEEDLRYRDHVVDNQDEYVRDFLGPFSRPILHYIGQHIVHVEPTCVFNYNNRTYYKDYATPLSAQYYMFIAAKFPGDEKDGEPPITKPQWKALRSYSAENKSSLFNYVNIITIRYFYSHNEYDNGNTVVVPFDEVKKSKEEDGLDVAQRKIFAYLQEIYYDQEVPIYDLSEEILTDLKRALYDLKDIKKKYEGKTEKSKYKFDGEKDYRVLELCCMYEYDWEDIADELRDYFDNPFPTPIEELSPQDKIDIQNRIAQWKQRAILHLTNLISDSDKYNYLKSAIIKHKMK